jgi:hypothetical protein
MDRLEAYIGSCSTVKSTRTLYAFTCLIERGASLADIRQTNLASMLDETSIINNAISIFW